MKTCNKIRFDHDNCKILLLLFIIIIIIIIQKIINKKTVQVRTSSRQKAQCGCSTTLEFEPKNLSRHIHSSRDSQLNLLKCSFLLFFLLSVCLSSHRHIVSHGETGCGLRHKPHQGTSLDKSSYKDLKKKSVF